MQLDVFKGDGFNLTSLTKAINLIPFYPTMLGKSGLFTESPITTHTFEVEMDSETLALVPAKVRGAPGTPVTLNRRNMRQLKTLHLPQLAGIQADEVQGLRAFGTESEEETAMGLLARRMALAKRRSDLTLEWQRMGAIKGQVIDSDGTTVLVDMFTTFGVTRQTAFMHLDVDGTRLAGVINGVKRQVEDQLGGAMYSGITVYCSASFFDAFVTHPAVVVAYANWSTNSFLRTDQRAGFPFGDIIWKEYRGKVGAVPFVEDGYAYAVPEGVPDLFCTHFSPANYMETVNTPGLPYYAAQQALDFNKGLEVETQTNPLSFNTRPGAVVQLNRLSS